MAGWIMHLWIADKVLERIQGLDRRGFCVGSIAPDCNVENEDWSAFTPPREVTHWMSSERKVAADCDRFYNCKVEGKTFDSEEERAFFLGYYAHLVADAEFQRMIRDERRVKAMYERIRSHPAMAARIEGMVENFDSVKQVFRKKERMRDIESIEAEYLLEHPGSGYLTVLQGLKDFPDYIDYLPKGAIVRKIGVMAVLLEAKIDTDYVFITKTEINGFVERTCEIICGKIGGY